MADGVMGTPERHRVAPEPPTGSPGKKARVMQALAVIFEREGLKMMQRVKSSSSSSSKIVSSRRFRGHFGCSPEVAAKLWFLCDPENEPFPEGANVEHLLWTLIFIKVYPPQSVCSSFAGGVDVTSGLIVSLNWRALW
jgi:hypothetical protein